MSRPKRGADGSKSFAQVPTHFEPFVTDANEINPFFQYEGVWEVQTEVDGPDGTKRKHRSLVGAPPSAVRIPIPPNTSFITVNGTAGPQYGTMNVTWEAPTYPDASRVLERPEYAPCNASRPYISTNELLYYANLDPKETYALRLQPGMAMRRIGLHSVTFYSGLSKCVYK